MFDEAKASPRNLPASVLRFRSSARAEAPVYETWSSTSTDTMPPVRTGTVMSEAFGTESALVSAGGCTTMVPVAMPCAFATV